VAGLATLFLFIPVLHTLTNAALPVVIVFLNSSSRAYTSKCTSQEGKSAAIAGTGPGTLAGFNKLKKAVMDENLVSYMRTNHIPASKRDQLA
jgi:hypothetical protein